MSRIDIEGKGGTVMWNLTLFRAKWLLAVAGLMMARTAQAAPETARSADSFINSIGVCTHWSYPDTPYGFAYEGVKQKLLESGIRHIRDGFSPRLVELGKEGIKVAVNLDMDNNEDGSPATVQRLVSRVKEVNRQATVIDAVEGPNEPDFFWASFKKSYEGQGYAQGEKGIIGGVIAFQKDLYKAMKRDPETRNLMVYGPALGKTYGYDTRSPFGKGTLTDAVDYGNFHPYCGGNPFSVPFAYGGIEKYYWQGNFPSANLDEFPFAFDVYAPPYTPKPMVATETGYSTDRGGVSEAAHAKYMPRLFCEYFRKGIARAYSYEFVDEFEDKAQTNREAHFGLLRRDLTPKPAYHAVKNLIATLQDGEQAGFKPGSLDINIQVTPIPGFDRTQYVHHLLLQKKNGDFYLLLWHEISDEDTKDTPHRQLSPPALPTTVLLPPGIGSATLYTPNDGTGGKAAAISNHVLKLSVPDKVVVVKLSSRL